jgi:hypothetical protein
MPLTAPIQGFRGNPFVTVTSITPGISANVLAITGVPAFFHLSACNTTANGITNPYQDLEYRWQVISGTEGYHKISTPWVNEIFNGATQSNLKDSETDQIGGEALFRFFVPGTKIIQLTVRGANGGTGYISATANVNLVIEDIGKTNHFWFDADNGLSANDGKDAWGFNISGGSLSGANITPGLYKIISKISNDAIIIDAGTADYRTLNSTGSFATYNHTTATSPADILTQYNYIGIIAGTASAGIISSNGPKKNNIKTIVNSNKNLKTYHIKGGNSTPYIIPTNNEWQNSKALRFIGYGITAPSLTSQIFYNAASVGQISSNHTWHNFILNMTGKSNSPAVRTSAGGTQTWSSMNYLYISECNIINFDNGVGYSYTPGVSAVGDSAGLWKCNFDNSAAITGDIGILTGRTNYFSMVGCAITGNGGNGLLDHHVYPSLINNSLIKWNNFGSSINRNYCVNYSADSIGLLAATSSYHVLSENFMSGTKRAWDSSNSRNSWTGPVFANFVAENNYTYNLSGDGVVLFYNCYSMTIRNNIFYGGTGGRVITPQPSGTTSTPLDLKIYNNRIFKNSDQTLSYPLIECGTGFAAISIRNNMLFDNRSGSGNVALAFDFSTANVKNNLLYTPGNTGICVRNLQSGIVGVTFGAYLAVDASGSSASPYWVDASGGDFSLLYKPTLSLTASNASIRTSWPSVTGAASYKLYYGTTPNSYSLSAATVSSPYVISSISNRTRYYVAGTQIDPYGYESVFGISGYATPFSPILSLTGSPKIMADGRVLQVIFEGDNPSSFGVFDWYGGKSGATNSAGGVTMSLSNVSALRYMTTTYYSNVPGITNATWDFTTSTVTATGAFANYRDWQSGDYLNVLNANGGTGDIAYVIASRVSDDQITLTTPISATQNIGGGNLRILDMDAGQGRTLILKTYWLIDKASEVITYNAPSLTFSCGTNLLSDYLGNSTTGAFNVGVQNFSVVDASGFACTAAFSRGTGTTNGITIYVAPGTGSDARTIVQAQNMSTPLNSVTQAFAVLNASGYAGSGSRISILEGTTDPSTQSIQVKVFGQSWYKPTLIDSYWDPSAGFGTQGIRPKLFGLFSSSAGGGPAICDYIACIGLHFRGNYNNNNGFWTNSANTIFGDCVFSDSAYGWDLTGNLAASYPRLLIDNHNFIRCIFRDCWDSGSAHTQGIYTSQTKDILLSQCHFDWAGRLNGTIAGGPFLGGGTGGGGTDIFSHSIYMDSESENSHIVWGNYISRGDGIQNRPGGCIYDSVFTEVMVAGFLSGGGRIANCYVEYGASFGTLTFSGGSYDHSLKRLSVPFFGGTGIYTSMSIGNNILAMTGTNITYPITAMIAATGGAGGLTSYVTLGGNGLGASADGATNIGGFRCDSSRGFGFQAVAGSDLKKSGPIHMENIVYNRLAKYGGQARAGEFAQIATYGRPPHIIARNIAAVQSGSMQLQYVDSTRPMKLDRQQIIIDNLGVTSTSGARFNYACEVDSNLTNYDFMTSQDDIFLTTNNPTFSINGVSKGLTQYQAAVTGETRSLTAAPLMTYNGYTADLTDWAAYNGLTANMQTLTGLIRNRPARSWPLYADMSECVKFMLGKYKIASGLSAVGNAPTNYYGVGGGTGTSGGTGSSYDPATYLFTIFSGTGGSTGGTGGTGGTGATGSTGGSGGATSAYNFTRVVVLDSTVSRARLMFNYSGGSAASRSVSTTLTASDLYGYLGLTSPTATDISITKMSWCVCGPKDKALELAWGICGSMTGYPFQYVKGSGKYNFSAHGIAINNPLTGNRNNNIQITNIGDFTDTTTASLTIEISKNKGFGITSS